MSTTAGKNNFRNPDVRKAAKYKLWILFKADIAAKLGKKSATIYGYNNKRNHGLDGLVRLAWKKEKEAELISLYDNQTKTLVRHLYQSIVAKEPKNNYQPQPPRQQKPRPDTGRPKRKHIPYQNQPT